MNEKINWHLPLNTVSESNSTEHWTKSRRRHKQQQFFIRQLFARETREIAVPCVITLTRCASRDLDDDNLRSAFKWIRDEISECIFPEKRSTYISRKGKVIEVKGRADSSPLIKWQYAQEKAKIKGIKIQIEPLTVDPHAYNAHEET